MSDAPSGHTPADADEAARILSEAEVAPALTGSLPTDPPRAVRESLAEEGRPVVSAERLTGLESYRPEDLTVTVGAGTRAPDLQARLRQERQWLPLPPSALSRSVGGLVAAAPATPYAPRFGPVRRQVLAVTVVTFDGESLEWGRAVMKDVAGYDMAGLVCGSRGRLGLVARVSFRVWPHPEVTRLYALRGPADDGGPAALAGVTAGVDGDRDWEPSAETWSWTPGGPERPPLLVELGGSGPSVEAREERLRAWAREEGLEVERSAESTPADDPAYDPAAGAEPGTAATLRFSVDPGYVAEAADAVVSSGAADRIVAHPRAGVLRVRCRRGSTGVDALEAGLRGVPSASVAVERGPRELHARADGRRQARRVELEGRVLDALGGRPRHWTGDFL